VRKPRDIDQSRNVVLESKFTSQPQRVFLQETEQVCRRQIRVLVALGSPMDCQLLQAALKRSRQRLDAVSCAVSKADIFNSLSRGNVDVALINADLEDGRMSGLDILPEIHASYQETPIVTLFDAWNDDLIVHAFRAGARGVFCRLETQLSMLWKCIKAVHQGQIWANSRQLQLLLNALRLDMVGRVASSPGMRSLAAREFEVANLVAEGMPNREVALKLGLTEHTVSNYLFRIYNKLGISSRVELSLYVMKDRERPDPARTRGNGSRPEIESGWQSMTRAAQESPKPKAERC
jgi:two-component system, NarL family, nitrate/nitrite response regulator NarL